MMEKIVVLEDVFKFIESADDIEGDCSSGSDMDIPVYDITAEEFLTFAQNAIAIGTKEGVVNAVSNLKRAVDCEMDLFFESINLKHILDKHNLKFEKKSQFLSDMGLFPVQSINKLNKMRNKMEHEYKTPSINDLNTYYELVWDVVKILDLNLELLYINGDIGMSLEKGDNHYYFTIKHDVENSGFFIEIKDWTEGLDREKRKLEVYLKNKEDIDNYINAFNFYLFTIKYFNFGNVTTYKNNIRKLMQKNL